MNKRLAALLLLIAVLAGALLFWRTRAPREQPSLGSTAPAASTVPAAGTEQPAQLETSRQAAVQPSSLPAAPAPEAAPQPSAEPKKPVPMIVHVVDDVTSFAVAGARIARSHAERPDLATDARGYCKLEFAPNDTFSLQVEPDAPMPSGFCRVHGEGYGTAEFRECAGHEREEAALEIRLRKSATLAVTLVRRSDPGAGTYTVRARADAVKLVANGSSPGADYDFSALRFTATCDGAGMARLEGLPSSVELGLAVLHGAEEVRVLPEPLKLAPGEEKAFEIDLGSGCLVRGRVIDAEGAIVVGPEVWLVPRGENPIPRFTKLHWKSRTAFALSNGAGEFDLGSIPAGKYWIGLAPDTSPGVKHIRTPAPFASINAPLDIAEGETSKSVDVHVQAGLFIRGKIVRPDGTPAPGGGQVFAHTSSFHSEMAWSREDGTFEIGPLLAERYSVRAGKTAGFVESLEVEAPAGASDVVLTLREGARVEIRVVENAGGPAVGAELTMVYPDGSVRNLSHFGNTTEEYQLSSLDPGLVTVTATANDGRIGILPALDLRAGVDSGVVEILLAPSARLRIRAADGKRLFEVKVSQAGLQLRSIFPENDGPLVVSVPPGELTVWARGKAFRDGKEQKLTVSAGEDREIVFEP